MTENKLQKRIPSQESRERMRAAALARSENNAAQIHVRVREIMVLIKIEMNNNNGIYPENKGAVSMAEVARRANIHPLTFHKLRYKELGQEVRDWLTTLKSEVVVGRGRIRKDLNARTQEWKKLYEDLLVVHRITETELMDANSRLKDILQEKEKLMAELSEESKSKIIPLQKMKGTD